ncbi:hypothetical protein VNO80_08774 [Phaseolus coccineus]|uniref:Uncharacterized protein n=1 Tax=Phaseolus coccineus TaxID=3886 RepID=A0AAN9N5I3_PHACN
MKPTKKGYYGHMLTQEDTLLSGPIKAQPLLQTETTTTEEQRSTQHQIHLILFFITSFPVPLPPSLCFVLAQ